MRIAIFVAIVAAHIALVWYFLTLWHLAESEEDDQSSMTLVFLAPAELAPKPAVVSRSGRMQPKLPQTASANPALTEPTTTAPQSTAPQSAAPQSWAPQGWAPQSAVPQGAAARALSRPDWRKSAEVVAQANAQHIVESEDRAARQAGALTAMIKPLPGPHAPGPSFHWDPNPRYRWQPAPGGGWVMPLNDHCDIGFFIMLWIGCSVGELPPAHGDLFMNMHPPVKFGDWDWRVDDP